MKRIPPMVEVSEESWAQVRHETAGAVLRHYPKVGRSTLSLKGETIARRMWPTSQGFPGRFEVRADYLPSVPR